MIKKLLLLLCSTFCYGQNFYGSVGSDLTSLNAKLGFVYQYSTEITIGNEFNPGLEFNRMYVGAGAQFWFDTEVFCLIPTIEPSLITRYGSWGTNEHISGYGKSTHPTLGLTLAMRYEISPTLSVEYSPLFLMRPDIKSKYPQELWNSMTVGQMPITFTNFVTLVYVFHSM